MIASLAGALALGEAGLTQDALTDITTQAEQRIEVIQRVNCTQTLELMSITYGTSDVDMLIGAGVLKPEFKQACDAYIDPT